MNDKHKRWKIFELNDSLRNVAGRELLPHYSEVVMLGVSGTTILLAFR